VTFTGGNLVVTIPAGSYNNGEKYCIVVAQSIPDTTTINAPVVIQIGTGATLYPVSKKNCAQLTASGLRTRTKYAMRVHTSVDTATFRLLGDVCCVPTNNLRAVNGDGTQVTTQTVKGGK
jgi:hypothetical protein